MSVQLRNKLFSIGLLCLFGPWLPLPAFAQQVMSSSQQTAVAEFIKAHKEDWFKQDLELLSLRPIPGQSTSDNAGWKLRESIRKGELDLAVFERPDPAGDPNNLFFYWNDVVLNIPLQVAVDLMSKGIDLSQQWTKEFTMGKLHLNSGGEDYFWEQTFNPQVAGVANRQLHAAYSVYYPSAEDIAGLAQHDLHDLGERRTALISCRSIPPSVSGLKVPAGHGLINWHGAYLFIEQEDGKSVKVRKLDRENQGGWFPSWMMNKMMPHYLNEEVERGVLYINGHSKELLERFKDSL